MSETVFDKSSLPPLGKLVEFDTQKKHNSRLAADIPFKTPEADPQLASAFGDIVDFIKAFQREVGIESTGISPGGVHILSPEHMNEVAGLLGVENNGGVYDPRADLVYVKEPEHIESSSDLIELFYALSHELGHKLTPGLNGSYGRADYSFILAEGMADRFARGFIHGVLLPKHTPDMAKGISDQFREGQTPHCFEGLYLRPDEILLVDPETRSTTGFSRIVEARIVRQLEALMGVGGFAELMRAASSTDILAPRQAVVSQLGIKAWNMLAASPSEKAPIEVLGELRG